MSHSFVAAEGIVLRSEVKEKNSLGVTLFRGNVCCRAESGRVYLCSPIIPNLGCSLLSVDGSFLKYFIRYKQGLCEILHLRSLHFFYFIFFTFWCNFFPNVVLRCTKVLHVFSCNFNLVDCAAVRIKMTK